MTKQTRVGVISALSAFGLWGVLPIYFKEIQFLGEAEILVHRIVWSAIFTAVLISVLKIWPKVFEIITNFRALRLMMLTALLISSNWLIFIWAVANDHMLDASLGYYINPLINIVLGYLFLGERLGRVQLMAVCLMVAGVGIAIIAFGAFPYVAFGLAISFGLYGLIRKKVQIDSQSGLFVETLLLLPIALYYWNFMLVSDYSNLTQNSATINTLLLLAGPVTSVPLMFFAAAAQRLNLGTIGFFQYLGPSIMALIAVFVYGEIFSMQKWVTFGFIWVALAILTIDSLKGQRAIMKPAKSRT